MSSSRYIERFFTLISSIRVPDSGNDQLQPFSTFYRYPAIVLLGDPGEGKTRSFYEESLREGALYVDIRDFLSLDIERYRGRTLYIDALDEKRVTSGSVDALDEVRGRLDKLGRPPFRLSCRIADWHGATDEGRLAKVSSDGSLAVINIEPLSEPDIRAIASEYLTEPDNFIDEARKREIFEILQNPLTLELMARVVADGGWPSSRAELFEKSTELIILERNDEHDRATESYSVEILLGAAGKLFAHILLAGTSGISLSRSHPDERYPFLGDLGDIDSEIGVVVRRRVFTSVGAEKVVPLHRSLAEFLSAKYLVDRVNDGFPLNRFLAVMTGLDGAVISDLRGLFAWLTCMLPPDRAYPLIKVDPFGIVIYGDVSSLSKQTKLKIIEELGALERRDPYFLSGHWARASGLGGLCSVDIVGELKAILGDPDSPPTVVACILLSICHGYPMPELREPLLELISRPPSVDRDFLRPMALEALIQICSPSEETLRTILGELHEGKIIDVNDDMRALLLEYLYPGQIGPAEIVDYLVVPTKNYIGSYFTFIHMKLIEKTPVEDYPILLDSSIRKIPPKRGPENYVFKDFYGKLLLGCLEQHGELVSPNTIYDWLSISLDEYGFRMLDLDVQNRIRQWLIDHPTIFFGLIRYWVTDASIGQKELWLSWNDFTETVQKVFFPSGFREVLLDLSGLEEGEERAQFLIRQAIHFQSYEEREGDLTLDQIEEFKQRHPNLSKLVDEELQSTIPEWQYKHSEETRKRQESLERDRDFRVKHYLGRIDAIVPGEDIVSLDELGEIYWGIYVECDNSVSPIERLEALTDGAIAQAALKGFQALLEKTDLPTPAEIESIQAQGRHWRIGYPLMAGIDQLYSESRSQLRSLSDKVIRCAVVFPQTHPLGHTPDWQGYLFGEFKELSISVLEEFWRPLFEAGSSDVTGIHLLRDDHFREYAGSTALRLLRDYPSCAEHDLRVLLSVSFQSDDRNKILELARKYLSDSGLLEEKKRLYWLASAFLLDPEGFKDELVEHIQTNDEYFNLLFSFFEDSIGFSILQTLPKKVIRHVLEIIAPSFDPSDMKRLFEFHLISQLIELLSFSEEDTDKELAMLSENPDLILWKGRFLHSIESRARRLRDNAFMHLGMDKIIETLRDGPPASPADLQAIILNHLIDLANEIRHGSTNPYRNFWNVDSYGRPIEPRPENDCRDQLLEMLMRRVGSLRINVEREGSYSEGTRADLKISYNSTNLPVEVKKETHRDLWSSIDNQLKKYTDDPGASGRGIYLVLWFGVGTIPTPPEGIDMPKTPQDLESTLWRTIPDKYRHLIEVIVLDVAKVDK